MSRNVISNPSFETNTTGWSGSGGSVSRVAGSWGVGAYTGRLTATTTGVASTAIFGDTGYTIPASPDDRAFASVSVRPGNAGAIGSRVSLRIDYLDEYGGPLGFMTGKPVFLAGSAQIIARIMLTDYAPPNTARARLLIVQNPADVVAGDRVDFDMVNMRFNELPDDYFDGDFANAEWMGTPHGSPSVRVAAPTTPNPNAWRSGGVKVEGFLYRCDRLGNRLDDLSNNIVSGSVTWNADRSAGVKMGGDFRLNRRGLVRPLLDFVAPVLRLTWDNGLVEEQQYGLFLVDAASDTIYQRTGSQGFRGLDSTWFPNNVPILDTLNFGPSDNVVSKMRDLIVATSWERVSFPVNATTFGEAKSIFPPTVVYDAVTSQFDALGLYYPYSDLDGTITTQPYADFSSVTPSIIVTPDDPVGEWEVIPTTTQLANIVTVTKENIADGDDPIIAVAQNFDPASRLSQIYRPPILREIRNSDIKTQLEADNLAQQYLREATSFYRVVRGKLSPGVWMRPYSVMDCHLEDTEWGSIAGRYHVREFTVGFTQSDAEVSIEANMWSDFSEGAL